MSDRAQQSMTHDLVCDLCRRARTPSERCTEGQLISQRAAREIEMDQRAIDQRVGRTYAEIEAKRKELSEAPESNPQNYADLKAACLYLGAWLALSWVLDDDETPLPLRERLRNAQVR